MRKCLPPHHHSRSRWLRRCWWRNCCCRPQTGCPSGRGSVTPPPQAQALLPMRTPIRQLLWVLVLLLPSPLLLHWSRPSSLPPAAAGAPPGAAARQEAALQSSGRSLPGSRCEIRNGRRGTLSKRGKEEGKGGFASGAGREESDRRRQLLAAHRCPSHPSSSASTSSSSSSPAAR